MPSSRKRSTKRPYGQPHVPLDVARLRSTPGMRREVGPGGEDYFVAVPRPSEKSYTCPGCHQIIPPDTSHLVAWAVDSIFGEEAAAADRRHWHTHCWNTFGRQG